jgi:hypothetical protein
VNAPRVDRWGDPIEPDGDTLDPTSSHERTRAEIHADRIAQLRAILRAARNRREAKP